MDNNNFESDQNNFFKRIEDSTEYEGSMPKIHKFVKFLGVIWERDDHTSNIEKVKSTPNMEKVRELKEKLTSVKKFGITEKR